MSAAAVTGGVLAVVVPAVALATTPPPPEQGTAALRLASDDAHTARTATVRFATAPLQPVASTPDEGPAQVADLVKAAGLHDAARKVEEERLAREAAVACDADLSGLGRVKPWVRDAARFLSCLYDEPTLIGVARRGGPSDHPAGLAVDLMARGARGDRIAECALRNREELGVSYVIWEQAVNHGGGWERMEDRGDETANHYDHVHVSFDGRAPGGGAPLAERCR